MPSHREQAIPERAYAFREQEDYPNDKALNHWLRAEAEIEQAIREQAYMFWGQEGCPNGKDLNHWLRAEAEILSVLSEPLQRRRRYDGDRRAHRKVKEFLAKRQTGNPLSLGYYNSLWDAHLAAGLVNDHFVSELTSGSNPKFFQRVWEMLLARHLRACGHTISSSSQGGPDFRFEHAGLVVWVEAISPEPGPDLSLGAPKTGTTVPHKERFLRWTTAFDTKWKKGTDYRRDSVIKREDAYVIAIDGSQLGWFPLAEGASRMPYLVEAVFAVGPLAFKVDKTTGAIVGSSPTTRFSIRNRNNSPVPTAPFFDSAYSNVSAVIGCVSPMFFEPILPICVAYNPLADVRLMPADLFGESAEQWSAELIGADAEGQDWELRRASAGVA